ncbi:hypothetical protein A3F08_02410 [Candidatus Berkelbacteria bacterium RIFCSPHIGHO2_12_FULL_36_9]|uniref:Type II secretion system protein GspF domain-containing protein n=1 Tax=Candidatus Berkelbacteria bacterium RIFCSPHIGHO2_12_FULL_36_9 TaxID=1797469 RepID=A0A1F5EE51_9BACT|nr:MAG: hypothetical protein A3F08_02410 [Candidatus Berkelbacteria bacterium RIFCSPHIGHO2_12_FULL_36_9]
MNLNFDLFDRVTVKDRAFLSRQLATMLSSGLSIDRAIILIAAQSKKNIIKTTLEEIDKDLQAGQSFSSAISRHPKVFDKVYVNVVVSGEAVGKLAEVLTHLSDQLESEDKFRGKIQGAMVYPIFIVLVMIAIMTLMMIKVIPEIAKIFKEAGAELPWTTKILIFVSQGIIDYWWIVIIAIIGIFIGLKIFLATDYGKLLINMIQINLPWGLGKDVYMARFNRTLGMLTSSGTPIIDAVKITADVMNNKIYKTSLENIASQLERGIPMSVPLEKDPHFPLVVPQMVMVGEQTGRIDQVLNNLANYYENQTDDKIKNLTALFEPALIVLIGIGVGFVVFSVLMPIYQVVQLQ